MAVHTDNGREDPALELPQTPKNNGTRSTQRVKSAFSAMPQDTTGIVNGQRIRP